MKYELQARYDRRNSFYGKAKVEEIGDTITLTSYDSEVARVVNGKFEINSNVNRELLYSQTTSRHIREFYKQFVEFKTLSKEEFREFEVSF